MLGLIFEFSRCRLRFRPGLHFPTCCPRSCLRRGRVLHHCFLTSLSWWRIKFLLSFDAYFCFVTNSLEKKKGILSSPIIKVCCYQVRDLPLNLRTETINALQPNTQTGFIDYGAASLQNFPRLSIFPYRQGKNYSSDFSKHYLLYRA